ncbi:MAG: PocR ligand-binding domain-containing protein, partial [Verrucomicrobia bacterium]|nr:PocR ligand-binding domain-containing protein [Verrucomicrobiota bacterium]
MLTPADTIVPAVGNSIVARLRRSGLFTDYQRAFESITGLPLMLREAGSFRTPLQGSHQVNPFCVLMTQTNKTCAACLQLQQRLEDAATREPRTLPCYAGLSESAVPVRLGDQVLGYLQTGQVFLRAPTNRRFQRAVRHLGDGPAPADLRRMESAYFQTRVLTARQYRSVVRLLATFAEHLAMVSNQMLLTGAATESGVIANARRYIAAHQTEKICLADVARAVNMSVFYFSRLFHQATGLVFMEYVARARVEAA